MVGCIFGIQGGEGGGIVPGTGIYGAFGNFESSHGLYSSGGYGCVDVLSPTDLLRDFSESPVTSMSPGIENNL
jgi:hypothetical protein